MKEFGSIEKYLKDLAIRKGGSWSSLFGVGVSPCSATMQFNGSVGSSGSQSGYWQPDNLYPSLIFSPSNNVFYYGYLNISIQNILITPVATILGLTYKAAQDQNGGTSVTNSSPFEFHASAGNFSFGYDGAEIEFSYLLISLFSSVGGAASANFQFTFNGWVITKQQ